MKRRSNDPLHRPSLCHIGDCISSGKVVTDGALPPTRTCRCARMVGCWELLCCVFYIGCASDAASVTHFGWMLFLLMSSQLFGNK